MNHTILLHGIFYTLIASDQDFEENAFSNEAAYSIWIKIAFCVILYAIIRVILFKTSLPINISGIISQIQVIISVYLTIRFKKPGYITAFTINALQCFTSIISLFIFDNTPALFGIIFPICTIIIISIIASFDNHLNKKFEEITKINLSLALLNEKLATAHNGMEQQNELLMSYNRIIKENEKNLSYQAFFDVLTQLPNRNVLINRLDLLITSPENDNIRFAVAFIDLDDFKKVNDTLGHHIGDLLLQSVAVNLKRLIHPDDMLGRLGGDEFALIIKRPLPKEEIFTYVEGLRLSLMENIILEDHPLSVSASFGISIFPQDGATSTELLKCADTAMYKAKGYKKNGISFYTKGISLQTDFI